VPLEAAEKGSTVVRLCANRTSLVVATLGTGSSRKGKRHKLARNAPASLPLTRTDRERPRPVRSCEANTIVFRVALVSPGAVQVSFIAHYFWDDLPAEGCPVGQVSSMSHSNP
jgi:hypothetical protein